MPTPTKGPRLGGSPQHQRLLLSNLATALFEHGRITTTQAKAKALRPVAERLITFAKRGDLHARRQALTIVRRKDVVHTLFAEIGPRFAERAGGYTRITKIGPRKGDNAPMAVIELVEAQTVAQQAVGEAERARGTRFARRRGGAAATEPTGAEALAAATEAPATEGVAASDETAATTADAAEPAADAGDAAGADGAAEGGEEFDESGAGNQAESASETSQAEGESDAAEAGTAGEGGAEGKTDA